VGAGFLAIGLVSLGYGYSDTCQTNNPGFPTDSGPCHNYRRDGAVYTVLGAVIFPVALTMK
jgi:hypothetical protein